MLSNEVFTAQIEFKIQVQEWKNILLRGYNISDKEKYLSEFQKKEISVRERLNNASIMADQLGLNAQSIKIKQLAEQHLALGLIYKAALDKASFETYQNIQKADQSVKGADRALETRLNARQQPKILKAKNAAVSQLADAVARRVLIKLTHDHRLLIGF